MKKTIVFDCNYICHKARFSVGSLNNGIIFGFLSEVINTSQAWETNELLFTWDSKFSYRKKYFPEYKKKRHKELTIKEKEDLKTCYEQMDLLRKKILPEMGFKNNYHQNGLEGDDIIAMITKQYFQKKIVILANDKDLYQLLSENVTMFSNRKKYTINDFISEYQISPKDWTRVKAIAGCTSDEVPGIYRVGVKTVCKFLNGDLKKISKAYQDIISPKGRDIEKFNHKLVDLPHNKTRKIEIIPDELNKENIVNLFKQYSMKKFLNERIDEWIQLINFDKNSLKSRFRRK